MAAKEKKKIVPPKLNKFMHSRNPYKTPPSFKMLATEYPEFRSHCTYDVSGKVHLDFKNPDALRALTTCLLKHDFGLEVNIPEGRLVPTLPLRLNYLLWLEDLLYLAAGRRGASGLDKSLEGKPVVGADIGMGAACVYPLLGAANFGWCMLGTEADPSSFSSARENVEWNKFTDQIILKKVEEKTILLGALDDPETLAQLSTCKPRNDGTLTPVKARHVLGEEPWRGLTLAKEVKKEEKKKEERDFDFDFIMTNPPFFSSEEEADTMAKSKKGRGEPNAAPTGAIQEKVTEGGEVEFIRRMVEESQVLQDKVRIFTTLIGTKAHVQEVKKMVTAASPHSSVFTEFCQGRTMRWGAAWTFAKGVNLHEVRSKKDTANNKPIVLLLPRSLMSVYSVPAAWNKVQGWLRALKVKIEVFKSGKYFVSANVKAFKPTWLHQRRQRRREKQLSEKSTKEEGSNGPSAKRKPDEELDEGEDREAKRTRIPTQEELEAEGKNGEAGDREEEDIEEDSEEEEQGDEGGEWDTDDEGEDKKKKKDKKEEKEGDKEEQEEEGKSVVNNGSKTEPWGDCPKQPQKGGLKCILKCNFQVKQTGGQISMEAYYLGGSLGKDGMNQLVQYMRNQLTNPSA